MFMLIPVSWPSKFDDTFRNFSMAKAPSIFTIGKFGLEYKLDKYNTIYIGDPNEKNELIKALNTLYYFYSDAENAGFPFQQEGIKVVSKPFDDYNDLDIDSAHESFLDNFIDNGFSHLPDEVYGFISSKFSLDPEVIQRPPYCVHINRERKIRYFKDVHSFIRQNGTNTSTLGTLLQKAYPSYNFPSHELSDIQRLFVRSSVALSLFVTRDASLAGEVYMTPLNAEGGDGRSCMSYGLKKYFSSVVSGDNESPKFDVVKEALTNPIYHPGACYASNLQKGAIPFNALPTFDPPLEDGELLLCYATDTAGSYVARTVLNLATKSYVRIYATTVGVHDSFSYVLSALGYYRDNDALLNGKIYHRRLTKGYQGERFNREIFSNGEGYFSLEPYAKGDYFTAPYLDGNGTNVTILGTHTALNVETLVSVVQEEDDGSTVLRSTEGYVNFPNKTFQFKCENCDSAIKDDLCVYKIWHSEEEYKIYCVDCYSKSNNHQHTYRCSITDAFVLNSVPSEKVISYGGSFCTAASFKIKHLPLYTAKFGTASFRSVNHMGAVPVLVDYRNGEYVFAYVSYIADYIAKICTFKNINYCFMKTFLEFKILKSPLDIITYDRAMRNFSNACYNDKELNIKIYETWESWQDEQASRTNEVVEQAVASTLQEREQDRVLEYYWPSDDAFSTTALYTYRYNR